MSHVANDEWIESVNDAREEPMTLSQAIDEVYNPLDEVVRENCEAFIQEMNDRSMEYGY